MKYDFYAQIYNNHKSDIENLLRQIRKDKDIKLKNLKAVKKQDKRWETICDFNNIVQEPIKSHLVFFELKEGQDSSWKNVLVEFYKYKKSDYEKLISTNETYFSKIDELINNDASIIKSLKFSLTLTSTLYTSSENNFYSIDNQFAKEKPTGLPMFKGSSLKGALRQAAIDLIEDELIEENYGEKFKNYESQDIASIEQKEERKDRFFFKKRKKLVQIFGNEKDTKWFTFKSLLATGGIKDVNKIEQVLNKINDAFEHYLKKHKVINPDGFCRGRFIFEDLYFKRVGLDVITPLGRKKRTPVSGPISYEVVPAKTEAEGRLIWFPFALVVKGVSQNEIDEEWKEDKEWIEKAFNRLSQIGIGAKTKDGWGRFKWEEI